MDTNMCLSIGLTLSNIAIVILINKVFKLRKDLDNLREDFENHGHYSCEGQ